MAHVSTNLLRGGRSFGVSDGKRTATNVYRVEFDDKLDGEVRAGTAPGVPREGDGHKDDGKMKVKSVNAAETDSPMVFHVTVNYEQDGEDDQGGGRSAGGLPAVRVGSIHEQVVVHKTAAGNPIVNSAGQPFITPPTMRTSSDTITVSGTTAFDAKLPAIVGQYRDTVNNLALFGYKRGELLLVDRDIKSRRVSNKVVWDVSLTWNAGDHRIKLIDNGMYMNATGINDYTPGDVPRAADLLQGVEARGAGVDELKRIQDAEGKPAAFPVLLDGKGQPLPKDAKAVELPFVVRFAMPHRQLLKACGLPTKLEDYARV